MVAFDSADYANVSGVSTSALYYGTTNPPWLTGVFPPDPGVSNVFRTYGWKANGSDSVLKWGFNYATNDP
jgi:hypothetical protein